MKRAAILFASLLAVLALVISLLQPEQGIARPTTFDGLQASCPDCSTATPVLDVDNQSGTNQIMVLRDNGTPVFSVSDGGTVSGMVLSYGSTGKKLVCGSGSISETVVSHGLATPEAALCSLAQASTGAAYGCSTTNAAGVVTISVFGNQATPVAIVTPAAVDWCVVGVP